MFPVFRYFPHCKNIYPRTRTGEHNSTRGRNSRNRTGNLMQPTQLLELDMYWKEQSNFQKIKECRALTIYSGLYADFSRKAIALFMCEVLSALLEEKEQNEELFNFVQYSLQELDEAPMCRRCTLPFFSCH